MDQKARRVFLAITRIGIGYALEGSTLPFWDQDGTPYRGRVTGRHLAHGYDEGKRCAEALAVSYARQYGVEVRIARIFNTYGPRMQ